jgi:adenylate cyclase, class 2
MLRPTIAATVPDAARPDDVRRNVELKASDPSPARTLEICRALGAADHGELWQRDTYFRVLTGGLKLREQRPGAPHLIQFERPDVPEERESRYRLVDVTDGEAMRAALSAALGVRVTVAKRRRLLIWRDVRIHVDEVDGLGTFVELEAVAPAGSDLARERRLVAELRRALAITDDRLVPHGYADLLLVSRRARETSAGGA